MKKIILSLIAVIILISCSGKPESQKEFEKFMNIVQSGNAKKYDNYMHGLGYGEVGIEKQKEAQFILEQFKKVQYEILSVKEESDTSEIQVKLKAPDLSIYIQSILEKYMMETLTGKIENEEQFFNNEMMKVLESPDLKYEETEIYVTMIKEKGKWVFSNENFENMKFIAILTGSLHKLSETE